MKRTDKEIVLLVFTLFTTISVTPFVIMRINIGDWLIASINLFVVTVMFSIFLYVFITRKVERSSVFLAIFSIVAVIVNAYLKGAEQVYWLYPAMVTAYFLLTLKWAIFLNALAMIFLLPALIPYVEVVNLMRILLTLCITNMFSFIFAKTVKDTHQKLTLMATHDALTSAGNRLALDTKLAEELNKQKRNPSSSCLILFDLDNFKSINDEFGHIIGDHVLIGLVKVVLNRIRDTDFIYRFGGEEFIIFPMSIELPKAIKFAEEIRVLIEESNIIDNIAVTASFAVAQYQQGESAENWINRADIALYQAKKSGKNRVATAK
jgi:diguanylate cyclase (GGDEF)-like protein